MFISELLLHPSEPLLISASLDGTIRLWRLDMLEQVGGPWNVQVGVSDCTGRCVRLYR